MSDFKAKMHQIRFLNFDFSGPHWGAYSARPDPLGVFKGPTSKGRERKGEESGRREREGRPLGPQLGSLESGSASA